MEMREILKQIDAISISPDAQIMQLKHQEDNEFYQVWRINSGDDRYILKKAKQDEVNIYNSLLTLCKSGVPKLYQTLHLDGESYLLMEYIEGDNLCKCDRQKLTAVLDALICLQQSTWNTPLWSDSYVVSLQRRQNRLEYLKDALLEEAYNHFLEVYQSVPRALCHDDLLPFNVIVSGQQAVLIDWEVGGILPYPTSFARLIAHTESSAGALFYMEQEDKAFAVDYYYRHLLKDKGISYDDWQNTLEYFLFYEYCEWVYVGNKFNETGGGYYQKYLPLAKKQAKKLLNITPCR